MVEGGEVIRYRKILKETARNRRKCFASEVRGDVHELESTTEVFLGHIRVQPVLVPILWTPKDRTHHRTNWADKGTPSLPQG